VHCLLPHRSPPGPQWMALVVGLRLCLRARALLQRCQSFCTLFLGFLQDCIHLRIIYAIPSPRALSSSLVPVLAVVARWCSAPLSSGPNEFSSVMLFSPWMCCCVHPSLCHPHQCHPSIGNASHPSISDQRQPFMTNASHSSAVSTMHLFIQDRCHPCSDG